MISVQSLTKRFADAEAVRGISFDVEKGEILGLLGPNGAGKTTTMRMLTCFVAPTSGTATVAGYDIYDQPLEVRKRLGYLPENVPLYGEMRVQEYLRYRARLKGVPRRAVPSRLDSVVERCGLREVRSRVIDRLSKGYRQRVGLADALVHNPPILILDEPTVGLDPNQIREVREMIRDLGREHTIILSSHILPEVEQVCGRVVIIHKGRIVAQDTTEALRQEIGGTSRLEVEMRGDRALILEALGRIHGVLSVKETAPSDPLSSAEAPSPARVASASAGPAGADASAAGRDLAGGGISPADAGGVVAAPPEIGFHEPQGSTLSSRDGRAVRATIECAGGRDLREDVFRLAVLRGWVLLGLAQRHRSLEDVFINLTTHDPVMEETVASGPQAAEVVPEGANSTKSTTGAE